jgi:hypothetical protein
MGAMDDFIILMKGTQYSEILEIVHFHEWKWWYYIASCRTSHHVVLLIAAMLELDLPASHFPEAIRRPTPFPLLCTVVKSYDNVSTHSWSCISQQRGRLIPKNGGAASSLSPEQEAAQDCPPPDLSLFSYAHKLR